MNDFKIDCKQGKNTLNRSQVRNYTFRPGHVTGLRIFIVAIKVVKKEPATHLKVTFYVQGKIKFILKISKLCVQRVVVTHFM